MGLTKVVRLLGLITWITQINAEEGSGGESSGCCSTLILAVQSTNKDGFPNPLVDFEDAYSLDEADFNGRPSWVSLDGLYGIWFIVGSSWVVGNITIRDSYRAADPGPVEEFQCPNMNSNWIWWNGSAWDRGREENCCTFM